MATLKVIALISGGKDSLFSILHCIKNGHEIVALANLYPESAESWDATGSTPKTSSNEDEDINSHMYQTVGHSILPLYAEALKLPLYRAPIRGTAANLDKDYYPKDRVSGDINVIVDETESLVPLLHRVKDAHPEANALSTGAILSSYQRTRVESVALRLALTPLSYLWQYPYLPPYRKDSLLHDMAAVGQEARIIKVASGGLGVEHLWANVADLRTIQRLKMDMGRFGGLEDGMIIGEGGEFETLAVDGPPVLWKKRIDVHENGYSLVPEEGGTAAVRIREANVVEKEEFREYATSNGSGLETLRVPKLMDDEFAKMYSEVITGRDDLSLTTRQWTNGNGYSDFPNLSLRERRSILLVGNALYFSNLSASGETAKEQMQAIAQTITNTLPTYNASADDIVFSTILLRSMSDFAEVNAVYGKLFERPNPPARVTVACGSGLGNGIEVVLSVIILPYSQSLKRGLHVQSRSYWAPANIGPYSQAIATPVMVGGNDTRREIEGKSEIVHIAGQIPLVPATMEVIKGDFWEEGLLSLQHLWRVGRAMGVRWWIGSIAFIANQPSRYAGAQSAVELGEMWKKAHASEPSVAQGDDEENDEDIAHRNLFQPWTHLGVSSRASDDTVHRAPLPDWGCFEVIPSPYENGTMIQQLLPPCFVVKVAELPRHAPVEWAGIGIGGSEAIVRSLKDDWWTCKWQVDELLVSWAEIPNLDALFALVRHEKETLHAKEESICLGFWEIFVSSNLPLDITRGWQPMIVPCAGIWNSEGIELFAAVRRRIAVE